MPTANPRTNVTLPPETAALLTALARKERKSISSLTKELVIDALERREDIALSRLADRQEKANKGRRFYSHREAWGDE